VKRLFLAFLALFLCNIDLCIAGSESEEEEETPKAVLTARRFVEEHQAVLAENTVVVARTKEELEGSIKKNVGVSIEGIETASELYKSSRRANVDEVKNVARVYINDVLNDGEARQKIRDGESIVKKGGKEGQQVTLVAEENSFKQAYRHLWLGIYKIREGRWSEPIYSVVEEGSKMTHILASCALNTATGTTPFQIRVELQGYNFPEEDEKIGKLFMDTLQEVYTSVNQQNKPVYEQYKAVVLSKGKIEETLQDRFLNLQIMTYNFLRSPDSQTLDALTMIKLRDITRGLRATLLGENWKAHADRFPRQFFEIAIDRYEHLTQFHLKVFETAPQRKAQITDKTVALQAAVNEECKDINMPDEERLDLFVLLIERANGKLRSLEGRRQEAADRQGNYRQRVEDERRKVAVQLDSFQANHVLVTFSEPLQWRLGLILKGFYSFLRNNSDYDVRYANSCARALIKGYHHLVMYHLNIVQNQQSVMTALDANHKSRVEHLEECSDKEKRVVELGRHRDEKVQKIMARVEQATVNPDANRISVQSKIDNRLGRVRGLLELQEMDGQLKKDLSAIVAKQDEEKRVRDLLSYTDGLRTNPPSLRSWGSPQNTNY